MKIAGAAKDQEGKHGMRNSLLAAFILCMSLGGAMAAQPLNGWRFIKGHSRMPAHFFKTSTGTTEGMTLARDVTLAGDAGWATIRNSAFAYGNLQQVIPLQSWRGKRLSVAVRLKNEGGARAWAMLSVSQQGGRIAAAPQQNAPGDGQWETRRFVLDIPDTATDMTLQVGLTDRGAVWVDGLKLEAAGPDVAVSDSHFTDEPLCCTNSSYGMENFWQ